MKLTNLAVFLLGALTATAWLARLADKLHPCEDEPLPAPHRIRGDCG